MWASMREQRARVQEAAAEIGRVSLSGNPAGVSMGGERRWLPVYAPGGYHWLPAVGDQVLVLKTGAEQEMPCVLGNQQQEIQLRPGEVCISGGSSRIHLGNQLELSGTVTINGQTLEDYIAQQVARICSDCTCGEE